MFIRYHTGKGWDPWFRVLSSFIILLPARLPCLPMGVSSGYFILVLLILSCAFSVGECIKESSKERERWCLEGEPLPFYKLLLSDPSAQLLLFLAWLPQSPPLLSGPKSALVRILSWGLILPRNYFPLTNQEACVWNSLRITSVFPHFPFSKEQGSIFPTGTIFPLFSFSQIWNEIGFIQIPIPKNGLW